LLLLLKAHSQIQPDWFEYMQECQPPPNSSYFANHHTDNFQMTRLLESMNCVRLKVSKLELIVAV